MSRHEHAVAPINRRNFITVSTGGLTAAALAARQPTQGKTLGAAPDPTLVEDLVLANHILAHYGIVDAFGHVSVRHSRNPNRYLQAWHVSPALVTANDILEYDLDSNPIPATRQDLYRERFIHGEIYKARPDVMAVVHSHSPAVIPFSVSSVPLRPVFHMAAFVDQGVPVFDTRVVPGTKRVLVDGPEAGRLLAKTLGNHPAVLLLGHGAAVVGTSLQGAVGRSIYLEMTAKIQAQAIALGGQLTYIDPEAARNMQETTMANTRGTCGCARQKGKSSARDWSPRMTRHRPSCVTRRARWSLRASPPPR